MILIKQSSALEVSGLGGGGEAGGVFAEGASEAGEGAAAAGCGVLAFEAPHGGQADPGLAGELFLGQPVPAAYVP
jgi:hypothetical protein